MAPQRLEKIDSAPGNGAAPDASDEAARLAAPAEAPFALDAPPTDRPEMAPQATEKARFAPENAGAPDPRYAAFPPGEAFRREAPAQDLLALGAPFMRRIEIQPQSPERAPRNDAGAEPAGPPASFVPARRPNVRAMLNGVMAC